MRADIVSFVDEGLGHASHLVDLGDGSALVVDAPRLPESHRAEAARRGLGIAFTADTHTHADYVSGSAELAADAGTFLAPADAALARPHQGLRHGDVVAMGRHRLQAIGTPGHTPDHLAYLLADDEGPVVLFSGGSLMVGTVGRPDLLGDEHRDALARDLYRSLHTHVLVLPDDLPVYPTHGTGSFCSAPGGGERTTTIGRERATNPLLAAPDEDAFVERLLAGLGSFPPYFRELPARNRRGVPHHPTVPTLAPLTLDRLDAAVADGAVVVDARPVDRYAAAHIPGSLSIPWRAVFGTWLGWLVPLDRPVVVVLDDDQDEADLVRQALRIGHDALPGRLAGGLTAWTDAGRPVATVELLEADAVDRPVLDVRQAAEFAAGHVPGAAHVELGELATTATRPGPVATMCGKTERAMTAASVLLRAGHRQVAVVRGGFTAWSAVAGHEPATRS